MILSSKPLALANISLCVNNVLLKPERTIKLLGILIDDKLNFGSHVDMCCKKAAMQLNAFSRISRYLDVPAKKVVYDSFVRSNFNYCPLVWHFCGKKRNNMVEKIQERALRIVFKDYSSSYEELLCENGIESMLMKRLRTLILEAFKSMTGVNSNCLNEMFQRKEHSFKFRSHVKLEQRKCDTTTYGLRSISYLGAKVWNDMPMGVSNLSDLSIGEFRHILCNMKLQIDMDLYPHYV